MAHTRLGMNVIENDVQAGTIEEFAILHGFEMVVTERRLPVGDQARYFARFRHVEEKGDGVLIGTYGDGSTKQEAIENYTSKISMKTLVFHGNTDRCQRIQAWRFNAAVKKAQE